MISLPFSLQVACKPKKEIIRVYIGLACKKSKEHPQKCINKMLQIQRRKKSYVFFCGNVGERTWASGNVS